MKKMKKTKKKFNLKPIHLIIITVLLIFAVINGLIYVYDIGVTNDRNKTIAVSDKPAADKIHQMAVKALETNRTQAKALFQTARRQYEYIVENTTDVTIQDDAQAGIIDCDAQLWLLEHA